MSQKISNFSTLSSVDEKSTLRSNLEHISEVLDVGIEKLLENKVNKNYKIEKSAKDELRNMFISLFTGLITPKIPQSISDCESRLKQWKKVDSKLKPNDEERESIKNIAIKGKKNKVCINFDKFYAQFKQWNQHMDMNIVLFIVAIVENILQANLKAVIDYQNQLRNSTPGHLLNLSTFKIIFAKYTNMENAHNLEIYDHIKRYTKNCKTWESIKNFHPFVKDCRSQVEVIIKIFKLPLLNEKVDEKLVNKLFGNIDDVYDSLGFIVEATEDCRESTKHSLGTELIDLVSMEVFLPFESYVKNVLSLDHTSVLDKLLLQKDSNVPCILVAHYGKIIEVVFGKSTQKRRTELMSKYHLLHWCEACINPIELPVNTIPCISSSSSSSSSQITTSATTLTTKSSSLAPSSSSEQLLNQIPSSSSGYSSSGHSSRGSSPYPTNDNAANFPNVNASSLSCNILVNCFRYLLPRLLLYPIFQFLYLYHILQYMSQSNESSNISETDDLSHVVRSMLQYAQTFNALLCEHDRIIQLGFERTRCWFKVNEGSRDNIKDGNQKLEEIDSMLRRDQSGSNSITNCGDDGQFLSSQYKGKSEFVMEGRAIVQLAGSNYTGKLHKSSGGTVGSSPNDESNFVYNQQLAYSIPTKPPPTSDIGLTSTNGYSERYLYLFSNMLLFCKKSVKKSGFVLAGGQQHSTKLRFKGKILLDNQFSIRDDESTTNDEQDDSNPYLSPSPTHDENIGSSQVSSSKSQIHSFIIEFPANSSTGFLEQLNNSNINSGCSPVGSNLSTLGILPSTTTLSSQSSLSKLSRSACSSTMTLTSMKTLTNERRDSMNSSNDRQSLLSGSSIFSNTSTTPPNQQQPQIILAVRIILNSAEEKADWMASLLMLQTHRLFSQFVVLKNHEEVPLKLPESSVYRFAAADSESNIEYEPSANDNSSDIPIIRAATLDKLITHLTSHSFCDTKTLNKFLIIYRQFTTAEQLLKTLIDRFDIPDPNIDETDFITNTNNYLGNTPETKPPIHLPCTLRDRILKRFRTSYKRKVQLRVINFIAIWTSSKHRFFEKDFLTNLQLLEQLEQFLQEQTDGSNHLTQKIDVILKQIQNKRSVYLSQISTTTTTANNNSDIPPPLVTKQQSQISGSSSISTTKSGGSSNSSADSTNSLGTILLYNSADKLTILNVHPVELAKQISLMEWKLYSKIEFWEVHGQEKSNEPNFLKSVDFSNKIVYWLILEIVTRDHIIDRATVILRIIDMMLSFEEHNNLQGAQECRAALISHSVFRLKDTFELINNNSSLIPNKALRQRYRNELETLRRQDDESTESYTATYRKRVHRIVAPAIPYIAMGDKTNLIHLDLINPNFIKKNIKNDKSGVEKSVELINFSKFRQMADLIEHYLSFQKIGYDFKEEAVIQTFLNELDPYKSLSINNKFEFDSYVYNKSLAVQPKSGEAPVSEKRCMTEEEIKFANSLIEQNLKLPSSIESNPTPSTQSAPAPAPPPLPPKKNQTNPNRSSPSINSPNTTMKVSSPSPTQPPIRPPRSTDSLPPPPPLPARSSHQHHSQQRHHSLSPPVPITSSHHYTDLQTDVVSTPPPLPRKQQNYLTSQTPPPHPHPPPPPPPPPPPNTSHQHSISPN